MKQYTKNNQVKTRQQIVIVKDGMKTINPTEDMLLADGWVEYVPPTVETKEVEKQEEEVYTPLDNTIVYQVPEVSDKTAFVMARHKLRNKIKSYDKSGAVNEFFINGTSLWLEREERILLQRRFEIEQKNGITHSTLWKNGVEFPLVISDAIVMLDAIEMYAIQSFDCTQRHYAAINNLNTIEEIENYDYTTGYPEKLRF